MPSQKITASPAGLYLQPNNLSQVPDGALEQADNVVISRDGIVEPRRGMDTIYDFGALGGDTMAIVPGGLGTWGAWSAPGSWLLQYVNSSTAGLYYYPDNAANTPATPTALTGATALTAPTQSSIQLKAPVAPYYSGLCLSGDILYGTGIRGIWRADTSTIAHAGTPTAMDLSFTLSAAGSPRALADKTQVAYRLIWVKLANGRTLPGSPSTSLLASNTAGGTRDVVITASVPQFWSTYGWGIQSGDVYQLYRTKASPTGTDPGDEMFLCYEGTYSSGATISVTDVVTDDLLGAALYTNASQQTALQANDLPPFCYDIASYRGVMFYANTVESYADCKVIATGTGALDVGSTITISGITITGAAVENIGAAQFLVDTASPSFLDRFNNTAASIVRTFNRNAAQPTASNYAVLTTAAGAGTFRIASKNVIVGVSISSTAPAAAFRIIQPDSGNTNRVFHPARIYWSKQGQPDAVPVLNYADVGDPTAPINRIVATRDSLFIFKEDGLFRLTGDGPPWDIRPFDPTCRIVGIRTAVLLDNSVFVLTTQGVVRVTDTGVTVISRPIDAEARPLSSSFVSNVAFAVANEPDRKYLLWMPPGDDVDWYAKATQAYVYDLFTQAWTRRTDTASAGAVCKNTGQLLLGGRYLRSERTTQTDADYSDAGAAISCAVKWAPKFATPGLKQHFQEVGFLFRKLGGTAVTLAFTTDLVPSPPGSVNVTLSDYGTPPFSPFSLRTLVPLEQARGSQLGVSFSQNVNGSTFQIQGLSLTHRVTDEEAGS
ncbi:MAG TPA: hypothetical protein VI139_06405 [Gemmatimonadales bacterium]